MVARRIEENTGSSGMSLGRRGRRKVNDDRWRMDMYEDR